jgi:DNA-directed RNA polymerase III subunit RPC1
VNQGFSIGIDDVMPMPALLDAKSKLIREGYEKVHEYIKEWKTGTLPPQPGCNAEQTLEAVVNSSLSNIREDAGKICIRVSS